MTRTYTLRVLTAILLVGIAAIPVQLSADESGIATGSATATIVLKHIQPGPVMWVLGIVDAEEYASGKPHTWRAGAAAAGVTVDASMPIAKPAISKSLAGITSVEPRVKYNSIVVRGLKAAVEGLVAEVNYMDVPPKQVQIKAEIIEVASDATGEITPLIDQLVDPARCAAVTPKLINALRKPPTRLVNAPIIATVNNTPATLSTGSETDAYRLQTSLWVLPCINEDKTITVQFRISSKKTAKSESADSSDQSLFSRRRLRNGESMVTGGFVRESEDGQKRETYLILTAKVVD